ncbi:glutamine-hydrolyzing carbamoyl-phosphate synthase small subunit [Erwinia piriflorinigrans]|uniref:glutamine-hydrolyzing carbamoyl-phosphate synthase small subunit n=1 Tax=Erwinia piriflorinigrans TaxID=665097 RepID=UPI002685DB71
MIKSALLVLEDGTQFHGRAIGATGSAVGEVVFNTSMTGYQEILTDPSYSRQIVTLTYPHIGNVGTNSADAESTQVHAAGLVIRDLPLIASNYRNEEGLSDYLTRHNIVAIADIDTRKLTRLLREKGAQNGCIIAGEALDAAVALEKARAFPGLKGMDLAKEVTTPDAYTWLQGSWTLEEERPEAKAESALPYHVVAYDYGVKRNILRMLVDRGCRLTVVPAQTSAEDVLKLNPDGVFLSNGPGDPEPCDYAITAINRLLETNIPLFGICLGHQLLALASGAQTVKMKLGHHGGNHPVKDHDNNTVMITAQNHGFAVDDSNLPANLRVTHTSLFDHTVQGIHRTDKAAFSFQGHPEASPGPHDAAPLFDHFIELIEAHRSTAK